MLCFRFSALAWLTTAALAAQPAFSDVAAYGARGGDIAGDTAAIQRAIDACASQGGGTVRIPAGRHYVIGTIVLKSHVRLDLEPGSLLQGSPNETDFTRFAYQPVNFDPGPPPKMGVVVYADGAEDVSITGSGRIDGNDRTYVTAVGPYIYTCRNVRPFLLVLKDCRRVRLRDFTLSHSAFWTLRLLGCDDALIDGLHIDGDLRMPNNDGIDIDRCANVRIQGCNISTGDDCISIKAVPLSEGIDRPCENVTITGCTLRSRSSAIAVGCDVSGLIRNVVVTGCTIADSHRGVSVRLSLEGSIEQVLFDNLVIETRIFDPKWWGRGEPIEVQALPWNADSGLGVIRDLRFSHLTCRGENGAVVYAAAPGHIENLSFDHVSLLISRPAHFPGGQQDLRPNATDPMPDLPTEGFLLRHAANVSFDHCQVDWGSNPPAYFHHALEAESCPGLDASGLAGPAAQPNLPAQAIR